MRVNLIEKEKSVFAINWLRVIITIAFAVAIMAIIFNYFVLQNSIKSLKEDINVLEDQIAIYKIKKQEYYSVQKKLKELKAKPLLVIPEYTWGKSIQQLGLVIPSRAMLDNVVINNNKITFSGKAYRAEDLREFKNNLVSSSLFQSVDLYKLIKEKEIVFSIDAKLAEGVD